MFFLPVLDRSLYKSYNDLSSTVEMFFLPVLYRLLYESYSDLSSTGENNILTSTGQITIRIV